MRGGTEGKRGDMKRLLRWAFNGAAAVSAILCLATTVLWLRSFSVASEWAFTLGAERCHIWVNAGEMGVTLLKPGHGKWVYLIAFHLTALERMERHLGAGGLSENDRPLVPLFQRWLSAARKVKERARELRNAGQPIPRGGRKKARYAVLFTFGTTPHFGHRGDT